MKKRKSPIILVTFLVVLVGIVIAVNIGQSQKPSTGQDQPPAATSDVKMGQSRATTNSKSVASGVAQQMGGASTPSPKQTGPSLFNKSRPTILQAPQVNNKPVPNESSTSTQWYRDDSHMGATK